jgi:hypothetical protein
MLGRAMSQSNQPVAYPTTQGSQPVPRRRRHGQRGHGDRYAGTGRSCACAAAVFGASVLRCVADGVEPWSGWWCISFASCAVCVLRRIIRLKGIEMGWSDAYNYLRGSVAAKPADDALPLGARIGSVVGIQQSPLLRAVADGSLIALPEPAIRASWRCRSSG